MLYGEKEAVDASACTWDVGAYNLRRGVDVERVSQKSAPAVFRYIPEAPLKKMFMGESAIPTDAIYVLQDMDLRQRREYEEAAFFGWKQADRWVNEGRPRPEYTVLAALFYQRCKESLTADSSAAGSAEFN